jgi:hypothetical protein
MWSFALCHNTLIVTKYCSIVLKVLSLVLFGSKGQYRTKVLKSFVTRSALCLLDLKTHRNHFPGRLLVIIATSCQTHKKYTPRIKENLRVRVRVDSLAKQLVT